jgi:hypothetical protein
MKIARTWIARPIETLLTLSDVKKVTYIVNEGLTIVATRKHKHSKRDRFTEILLTIGKPNYSNRQFIKDCVKAGESFPVKKMRIQMMKGL